MRFVLAGTAGRPGAEASLCWKESSPGTYSLLTPPLFIPRSPSSIPFAAARGAQSGQQQRQSKVRARTDRRAGGSPALPAAGASALTLTMLPPPTLTSAGYPLSRVLLITFPLGSMMT